MNCENCGIPQGAYTSFGYMLSLNFLPQIGQKWTRQQKRTVWACGSECAVQTMAIAAMGLPTHKWHMTLKEFISQMKAAGKLDFLTGQKRDKSPSKTRINSGPQEVDLEDMALPHIPPHFVTLRGRPKVDNANAATRRKRRQRAKATASK